MWPGLLDAIAVLTPAAQAFVINEAASWPDQVVRRLALSVIAERDGVEVARQRGCNDPNASIRSWAESLTDESGSETALSDPVAREPSAVLASTPCIQVATRHSRGCSD